MKRAMLVLLLLTTVPAIAEDKPAQKPAQDVAYSTSSLDLSIPKLPPRFAGHDPQCIYDTLTKRLSPKKEFETTQQYQTPAV